MLRPPLRSPFSAPLNKYNAPAVITPLLFDAPLKTSIIPRRGQGTPTFTRSTTATFVDFEGVVRTAKAGEARFQGARRVENLIGSSQNLTNASLWINDAGSPSLVASTMPDGTTGTVSRFTPTTANSIHRVYQSFAQLQGVTYLPCFDLKADGIRYVYVNTGATLNASVCIDLQTGSVVSFGTATFNSVNLGNGWWRVWYTGTGTAVTGNSVWLQANNVNVATDTPYAADGTSGFLFRRGQIENVTGQSVQTPAEYVSTGVLVAPYHGANVDGVKYFSTKLDGSPCADTGTAVLGFLTEGARTNLLLNSAVPVTQSITTTAQQYTISMWGTGTCTMSGAATGTLTGTGAANRVQLTVTANAGTLTLTFAGSNTNGQAEAGASASSYIPTTSAAVTRVSDSDTTPVTPTTARGSMVLSLTATGAAGGTLFPGVCLRGANMQNVIGWYCLPNFGGLSILIRSSGTTVLEVQIATPVAGTKIKLAVSWANGRVALSVNGAAVTAWTSISVPVGLTTFDASALDTPWLGTVTDVKIYSAPLSDSTLQALTA